MSHYILAIDQGTTGSTVSIIDPNGRVKTKVDRDFPQHFPKPGWVEHDPEDIWDSVLYCIRTALEATQIDSSRIAAIGITNQRETVMAWERATGQPVGKAIVWQCRRTTDMCKKLKSKEKIIRKKTGLVLDPYFSASKMRWILENNSEASRLMKSGKLRFGTVDAFLISRLTGGRSFFTDHSNASRTMLYNLAKGNYDSELLKLFKVNEDALPQILESNGLFGNTYKIPGLMDGIPIHGVLGDQQAALFGQLGFNKGDAKITFGTGSFLLFNTGNAIVSSQKGLLSTVAWKLKDQKIVYALEGGAFVCGAAVQWLRDGLEIIKKSSDVEALARSVDDAGGVEFVPALTGLGAPYWEPEARGVISGLTRGSTKAHIARATLEGMALQNVDILEVMRLESKAKLSRVRVDGGATENELLMQLQSDYLGIPVEVPTNIETTSAGAAYMAGLGVGVWKDLKSLSSINPLQKKFTAKLTPALRKKRLQSWHKAVFSSIK
ncbi:MAG: glycerol kinase GlpK [Bdellovibrionaceae bacterium]|nr:glycerol kinase GlpK [Pseudobdellovibrionaceae bacterium]